MHDPRRYTVLVAEDDPAILDLLRIRLSAAGYRLSCARDGREALDLLKYDKPDAAVLDVNMPNVDGFEVLKALKGNPKSAHAKVMMLTARNVASDVKQAVELGASDYLTKPFDDSVLLLRLARMLQ